MLKKYAIIAEGDVFMTISFDDADPQTEAWVAGLVSNPVIVEITNDPNIQSIKGGWTWDGNVFAAPE